MPKQKSGLTQEWAWLKQANVPASNRKDYNKTAPSRQPRKADALDYPGSYDRMLVMDWCVPENRGKDHIEVSLTRSYWTITNEALAKWDQGWRPKCGCIGRHCLIQLLRMVKKYEETYKVQIRCHLFDTILCDRLERTLGLAKYTLSTGGIDHETSLHHP